MSEQATKPPVRGRAAYTGFRSMIKAVGVGPRGSRSLTFEEARDAGGALLDGEASEAQAGAFLLAMRVKGETPEELAGLVQALRDRAATMEAGEGPGVLVSAGAFDGVAEVPPLGLAASVCAAAAGARVVVPCGRRIGPKHGVTPGDVLRALGGDGEPSPAASEAMMQRAGVALVHAGIAISGWEQLATIRDEVGLRGPLHSAEKLVDWFGASRFVVGHTHGSYTARLLGALERLRAERAIAVRGIEGSDLLRPGRPAAFDSGGQLDLPEQPGMQLRGDPDPELAADLTRAVLAGEEGGAARRAVVLSGAVRLLAAGAVGAVGAGARRCSETLDDGRATGVLDALVG